MTFDDLDLAWAAGFTDAEGAIHFSRKPVVRGGFGITAHISLGGMEHEAIDAFCAITGALKTVRPDGFALARIAGSNAVTWARKLRPYLLALRWQADLLPRICEVQGVKGKAVSLELAAARQALIDRMEELRLARRRLPAGHEDLTPEAMHAWAAGVMDGDGCFQIERSLRGSNCRVQFAPRIEVGVTERCIAEQLLLLYGGHLRTSMRGKSRMPVHYWCVKSRTAINAAANVAPYLRQKKEQAAALAALSERSAAWPYGEALSSEEIAARVAIKAALDSLKSAKGNRYAHG